MKTEWVHKKLGDCCESELGKTLDEGRNTGLYRPYLCALNVLWGKIDISIIKQMRIEDSELERYLVKKGDLLVCEGGEIGRCAIWENDDEIYYQNALHRVRFYKEYDAYFFMYLLCHYNDLKLIEQYGKGLTIKHLNQTAFRNIPVCVPDLSAQRRIAAILASADKVIAATQKLIAKYKQIKQGMMEDLLKPKEGWKMVKLGEVGEIVSGGTPSTSNETFWDGDVLFVTPLDLGRKNKIDSTLRTISKLGVKNSSANMIKAYSLAISTRAPIGLMSIINQNFTTNQGCKSIQFYDNYDSEFFYYYLSYNVEKIQRYGQGTTFMEISKTDFSNLEFTVPYFVEQRRIAAILSGIDAKIAAEEKVLEKYEKVKKGLMERLLNEEK